MRLVSILEKKRGALDLSATGTGKTVCTVSVAKLLKKPLVVVCPLGVIPGWKRTAEALDVPYQVWNYESSYVRAGNMALPKDALVIYDEAHRCKNYKTLNAKSMLRISRAGHKILALSATIAHHAEHLRAWNDAFRFGAFSSFMYTCGYYYEANRYGGSWLPRYADSVERTKRVIAPFTSCMTLEDAKALFKENSVSVEIISSKEDKKLSALYEKTYKEKRKGDKTWIQGDHLTKMLRARQASEEVKIPYVVDEVERVVDEGRSVVVFCNFDDTLTDLFYALEKFKPAVIAGGQLPSIREAHRKAFQDGETFVILCNLQSGGVGLDLHDVNNRPRYSIILPSWSAVDLKQALGRTHRAGSKSAAVQKILYSDVPVEKKIAEAVKNKLHALDTLHDSEVIR